MPYVDELLVLLEALIQHCLDEICIALLHNQREILVYLKWRGDFFRLAFLPVIEEAYHVAKHI